MQAVNISVQVRGKHILQDIGFDACAGELLVILGSNGAGKSTLLKVLSGELHPATGHVDIQGKPLSKWHAAELAGFRAVLQQQTVLTLPFTVYDVVMMGRYPHFKGHAHPIDHHVVRSALKKTGIQHLAERNYLTLSGGEQQRVHLARVFAQIHQSAQYTTRYLLMDEPVNSLDVMHQHTTLQLAKEFAAEGNCVVAVLHDLNLAIQYADKILMLKNGKMVCCGDVKSVLQNSIISHVYGFPLHVLQHPSYTHPVIMPAFSNNQTTIL